MKTLQERIDEFAAEQVKGEQLLKDIRAAFQPEFEAIEAKLMPTYSLPNYDVLVSEEDHKPYIRLGKPRVKPEIEMFEGTAVAGGMRCLGQEELKELNDKFKPDFDRIKIKYGFKVAPFSYDFEFIKPLEEYNFELINPLEENTKLEESLYSEGCSSDGGLMILSEHQPKD